MTNAEARFNKIHIRKVYACLAVTCHLHFWQNDRDFLRATVVTRGWNGYRNKCTESRPWRRKFSRRSSRDSNPRPFNHGGALTTELPRPLSRGVSGVVGITVCVTADVEVCGVRVVATVCGVRVVATVCGTVWVCWERSVECGLWP